LEAWAVFSNHYHFVAHNEADSVPLANLIRRLHSRSAVALNKLKNTPGRRVWFNYWDTQLTYQRSYLARLNYVHQNPVKHGLLPVANQ
jgi:putative transposase